jgi:hypothetical protein
MPVITPPFASTSTRVYPNALIILWEGIVFTEAEFAFCEEEGEHYDPNPEPHLSLPNAFRTADWDKTDGFIVDVPTYNMGYRIIKVTVGGRKFYLRNKFYLDPHGYTFMAETLVDIQ